MSEKSEKEKQRAQNHLMTKHKLNNWRDEASPRRRRAWEKRVNERKHKSNRTLGHLNKYLIEQCRPEKTQQNKR